LKSLQVVVVVIKPTEQAHRGRKVVAAVRELGLSLELLN
jgi:hypothetical protein